MDIIFLTPQQWVWVAVAISWVLAVVFVILITVDKELPRDPWDDTDWEDNDDY